MGTIYLLDGQHPLVFGALVVGVDFKRCSRVSAGDLKQAVLLALVWETLHLRVAVQDQLALRRGEFP